MTTSTRQRNSSPPARNILLDRAIPVVNLCLMNIPDRKAALS
jgi:hypothetical protein